MATQLPQRQKVVVTPNGVRPTAPTTYKPGYHWRWSTSYNNWIQVPDKEPSMGQVANPQVHQVVVAPRQSPQVHQVAVAPRQVVVAPRQVVVAPRQVRQVIVANPTPQRHIVLANRHQGVVVVGAPGHLVQRPSLGPGVYSYEQRRSPFIAGVPLAGVPHPRIPYMRATLNGFY